GSRAWARRPAPPDPRSPPSSVTPPTAGLSRHAYEHAAGDDQPRAEQEPASDQLASRQEKEREPSPPERLGRDERVHDADASAVVGAEERKVGRAEEHRRRKERD